MTLSMNMEQHGLRELQSPELLLINGGETLAWPSWMKKLSGAALLGYVVENWSDIKQGFVDGWNIDKQ